MSVFKVGDRVIYYKDGNTKRPLFATIVRISDAYTIQFDEVGVGWSTPAFKNCWYVDPHTKWMILAKTEKNNNLAICI